MPHQPLEYLVILDFEATCDDKSPPSPQEVIEFPSVLLATATLEIVDEFASFVRPQHHPRLTKFCREFTGIRQADVDAAPLFVAVLQRHLEWLQSHGLSVATRTSGPRYALALCGDWDLGTMLPLQCRACVPPLAAIPPPYRQWVNLKRPFAACFGVSKAPGMAGMLQMLGLELAGRHHRGIDDCRNIARIARELIQRGQSLEITTTLPPSRYPPIRLTLRFGDQAEAVTLEHRTLTALFGAARRLYRRQINRAARADGTVLARDEDLIDLLPETAVVVAAE